MPLRKIISLNIDKYDDLWRVILPGSKHDMPDELRFVPFEKSGNWPIYINNVMFAGFAVAERDACFDYRLDGGSLTPPDFLGG